jgi:phage tail-like protein
MPIATDALIGMAMRFAVTIDDGQFNLESWSKATGLEVTWDLVEYRAGDHRNDRWFFPGLTKYPTIKLERAATIEGTEAVKKWLNSNSFAHKVQSGSIVLKDAHLTEVSKWDLRHVIPVKWSVSGFEATSTKVALETLELAHLGFLTED